MDEITEDEQLMEHIHTGLQQLDQGQGTPWEEAKTRLDKKHGL